MPAIEAIGDAPEELRRSLRDLVALSMLPATWEARCGQIAESVTEVLVRMLGLEFAFVTLRWRDRPAVSWRARPRGRADRSAAIGEALAAALADAPPGDVVSLANPVGCGRCGPSSSRSPSARIRWSWRHRAGPVSRARPSGC